MSDNDNHQEQPDFFNETADLKAISKRYRVSLPKVYDWLEAGLPSMKIGRKRLVHVPTADAWVKGQLTGEGLSTSARRAQEQGK